MGLFRREPGVDAAIPQLTADQWAARIQAWSPEERTLKEKALVRHIDRRLLPMLILMYILNYIDRNALPQARIQGLEKDLGLVGDQYNVILSLLFVGYILGQVPSNMILSRTRPSIYLPGVMIAWGIVSGCAGATNSYTGMAICRFFLGITEAPFFAGTAFLFSGWYTQKELGIRLGIFFCGAMLSGAFAGLFAAGIAAAFANNAIASWRWLFIIEGIATVVVACAAMFVIPNWPSSTKWLTAEERQLSMIRMIEDAGREEEDISPQRGFVLALKDPNLWLLVLGQVCVQAIASLTSFLPTLVKNFGYGTIQSLLLTSPPYLLAAFFCVFNTWYSDRTNVRSLHIILPLCVTLTGLIITISTSNVAANYVALMLMIPATYGCFQISNAWVASVTSRPKAKRAVALALNNSFGNTALVWTPYLYPASAGPRYTVAWSVNLALCVVGILSAVALRLVLQRKNRALDNELSTVERVQSQELEKVAAEAAEVEEMHDEKMQNLEAGLSTTLEDIELRERAAWRYQI